LHLVQNKKSRGTAPLFSGSEAGRFPLLLDPEPVLQNGLIGGGIVPRAFEVGEELPCQGRLSRLAGPRQHLDKSPWLTEPFCHDRIDWAFVHGSSKITQYRE